MPNGGNNRRPGSHRRGDSFLARWSRRKHEAERGPPVEDTEPAETPIDTETQASGTDADPADGETAAAVPDTEPAAADADLPHPDTLDRNSDFSVYLSKRVSSAFRRAAMRRLFSSPEFNIRDGLDDYDEDYTQFQSLGSTVTAHMRHHTERLRQRDEDRAEQAERDAEAGTDRERTAEQADQEQATEQDAAGTPATDDRQAASPDDPTSADDAPDRRAAARTATNRDTNDTT